MDKIRDTLCEDLRAFMSLLFMFITETKCILCEVEYQDEETVWDQNIQIEHGRTQTTPFKIARRLRYIDYDRP